MNDTKTKLKEAEETAAAIDSMIRRLNAQVGELVSILKNDNRLAEACELKGIQLNLNDSFYSKVAHSLTAIRRYEL